MNLPLPDCYKNKYSVVLYGGSLEHIFNFSIALKNCMDMVNVGGNFMSITPCNNFTGHGFYQFSPEILFRCFSKNNGFQIEKVFIVEDDWHKNNVTWFSVVDPDKVRKQAVFRNNQPTFLMVLAKKISSINTIDSEVPQQSFYTLTWSGDLS
ncbi:hypothetical protein [Moorena sp. SIO4A5]|uniref:hypothetical protein n=1 Tax=Moorena sp. SIO4A5 TaxID=2607838 RepID=UPI0013C886C9|nr:hypothetical protein [Moorena sp. SIO4A5]NEO22739.1 hypothetical protein [Moorena sp. SIO4A5]